MTLMLLALAVLDAVMLMVVLATQAGRQALGNLFSRQWVVWWPPRAVWDQLKPQR